MKASPTTRFFLTVAIASLGGWIMWSMHFPLAWLLGAMIACGAGAAASLPVGMPRFARPPMTAAIGAMLGSSFEPSFLAHIGDWTVSILGLAIFIGVAGAGSYAYFRRVAGLDRPTAYFAAMPGGIVEMVTLGHERGGDERMIALIHAARLFIVVLTLPFVIQWMSDVAIDRGGSASVPLAAVAADDLFWFFLTVLAGAALGELLKLPARYLLGPMFLSAAFHLTHLTDFDLPFVVLAAAQVVIGASIGSRFAGTPPKLIGKALVLALGSITLLLTISIVFASVLSFVIGDRFVAILLAYSPGGLAEMSLIALSLDVEVPFVVVHHLVRVLIVLIGSSMVFAAMERWKPDKTIP